MASLKTEAAFTLSDKSVGFDVLSERQIINTEDVDKMKKMDKLKLQEALASALRIDNYELDLQQAIFLEYFVTGFWWAKQKLVTSSKICVFMAILNIVLHNIKEVKLNIVENLIHLKKSLTGVSADPLTSPSGLTMDDVHKIMNYLTTDIFQHYKLYEFTVSNTQDTMVVLHKLTIETAKDPQTPYPPPLEEAIAESIFNSSFKQMVPYPAICTVSTQSKLDEGSLV